MRITKVEAFALNFKPTQHQAANSPGTNDSDDYYVPEGGWRCIYSRYHETVVRYAPWWLNLEFFGVNQAHIPADVFDTFPDDVKLLYDHRVEGCESEIWA